MTFFDEINQVHTTIKFDFNFSTSEVNFLDLTIYKDKRGKLQTRIYTKPTDKHAYLHKNSAHPYHLKKSIPYGQALRLKRICSDEKEFIDASKQLTSNLLNRGYEESEIKEQINKANERNREELLQYKPKESLNKIPYVITYNTQLPNLKEAIDKHWNILNINTQMQNIFKDKPIIAFRRNKNLRDILGQKTLRNGKIIRKQDITNKKGWCRPCNSRNFNLCCQQVRHTNTFQSNKTKEEFRIYHRMNCKSKFIIYLLECTRCGTQYIGKPNGR